MLADMMSRFPDMEYLSFNSLGKCLYSLHEGKLNIGGHFVVDGALMTQLLHACRSVRLITIYGAVIQNDAVEVIKMELGNRLERFSLIIYQPLYLLNNVQTCGLLVNEISLFAWNVTDAVLQAIATHCPLLQSLSFQLMNTTIQLAAGTPPTVTDEVLGILFGACQVLSELTLTHCTRMPISRKTLQNIVDRKLRLKTLYLYRTNLEQHDIDWFCEEVKKYFLPVTAVSTTWN